MRLRFVQKLEALLALATLLCIAAAVAWTYTAELKGPLLDALASDVATRRLGTPVSVYDVRVRHWRDIRFGAGTVSTRDGRTLVAWGSGRLVVRDFAFLKGDVARAAVRLDDVALLEDLYRRSSLTSWAASSAFRDPIFVRRIGATMIAGESFYEGHLHAFDSDEMVLAGGIRWAGRRFLKANIMVLLPEAKFEKVPKELRARMIRRAAGWKGFRVTFAAGHLVVYGASGPFFAAQWGSAS